jgi:hypothetical protein
LLLVETILTRWMLKRHFCYRRSKDERSIDIQSWCQERLRMRQEEHFQVKL